MSGLYANVTLQNFIQSIYPFLVFLITTIIYFAAIIIFIIVNAIIMVWMERRVSAFFQERLGPNRNGPWGLFQMFYDVLKLLGKEAIVPKNVDKWVYLLAPMFVITTAIIIYALIPFGKGLVVSDAAIGLFLYLSLASTTTIGILMAGWGSNNKYSLLGGMRAVAQIISYEIPLAFSILGVVMITGTLNLSDIINAQKGYWFILIQPLAFVIMFIAGTAELHRAPFDFPEAEQELTAGYSTEYTGIRFAIFYLSEYTNMLAMSGLITTLFLGGWRGPFLPSWLWFIIKVYVLIFMFMWIRWTFPRIRIDKMMKFNWKYLIPLSLVNILLTGIGMKIYQYFTFGVI